MYYITKIEIYRQIVFLCGPKYDKQDKHDRRNVLLRIVPRLFKRSENKPVFIIADNLLSISNNKMLFNKYKELNIKLLEEIISSISSFTYIFLDSLSTAYELGLFSNSHSHNVVRLFVDEKRSQAIALPSVGDYINEIFNSGNIFYYNATYDEKNHIQFFRDKIPESIKKIILEDNSPQSLKQNKIFFEVGTDCDPEQLGKIRLIKNHSTNSTTFEIGLGTLFQVICYLRSNMKVTQFELDNVDYICEKVLNLLKSIYIATNDCAIYEDLIIFNKTKYEIITTMSKQEKNNFKIAVLNEIFLIKAMINNSYKKILPYFNKSYNPYRLDFKLINFDFLKLFLKNENDMQTIKLYLTNPNLFTRTKNLIFKKKFRSIVTYKNNKYGKILKKLHEEVNSFFNSIFNFNDSSFAYKTDRNCLMCVKKHTESNYYIKIDIHNFFNSMRFRILENIILTYFDKIYFSKIESNISIKKYVMKASLENLLRYCYYDKSFPIGFSSSPVMSNIYLNNLDENFQNKFPNLIYTRYADDILISSKEEIKNIDSILKYIDTSLKEISLQQNLKKQKIISFKKDGDYIKFLGLVLIKTNNSLNQIKISKTFFNKTIYVIKQGYKYNNTNLKDKGLSMLQYIKIVDIKRYNKAISLIKEFNII